MKYLLIGVGLLLVWASARLVFFTLQAIAEDKKREAQDIADLCEYRGDPNVDANDD